MEAWRELADSAAASLPEVVSLSGVASGKRQAGKSKFTHSLCSLLARWDKHAQVELEVADAAELPSAVPRTPLRRAACVKDGLVDVRAIVADSSQRELPSTKETLRKLNVCQPARANEVCTADVLAWGERAQVPRDVAVDIYNLAAQRSDKSGFCLIRLKQTLCRSRHPQLCDKTWQPAEAPGLYPCKYSLRRRRTTEPARLRW